MLQAEQGFQAQSAVDLTNCDREPIHHIGSVQPIGFLIAIAADWIVVRVSANASEHLGRPVEVLLGAQFADVIGAKAAHTIRNRLSLLRGVDAVERAFAIRLQDGGPWFDVAIHVVGQDIVIEAEPSQAAGDLNAGAMVRSMLARMQGQVSLTREAARLIQALTGFDRVMIYRFHPDQSGEVIAERVRPGLEPYLGLRYPAEDIPRQARALLLRNPVRLLADVGAEPSPILPWTDQPLDLSMSTLRAHSPMHVEYLKNMGVGATMTISLVRDGVLWGLISCHHMTPRHVGFEQRTTAELFAQMLSFLIEKRERDEQADYAAYTRKLNDQLIAAVVERGSAGESIAEMAERMVQLVPCDGIAVYVDGHLKLHGITPTEAEFASLTPFLDRIAAGKLYATEQLGHVCPSALAYTDRAAGLLAIPLSRSPRDHLVFFRREVARTVVWAGEPGKVVLPGPHGDRLTPRKSFEAWNEIVRGHSAPWTEAELHAAEALRI
ncbi:MAG: GAF domain-containing protein, partial [Janthinobacterium lividum]